MADGIFILDVPSDIAPGDGHAWHLPSTKGGPNNEAGYYKRYLPASFVAVTNQDGSDPLRLRAAQQEDIVPPNTTRVLDSSPVESTLSIENIGGATISADNITVQFGADYAPQKSEPWMSRALDDLIPGGTPW